MIKRLIQRGLYYVQTGSSLGSLPLSLLNFATIFYYNVVVGVAWLSGLFSNYIFFVLSAGILIPIAFGLLGYWYKKKSNFYMSLIEIDVEANKYQIEKIAPVGLSCWELVAEIGDKLELDTSDLKKLLVRSGSKKYVDTEMLG